MPNRNIWALDLGAWSMKAVRGRREKGGEVTVDVYDQFNYQSLGVDKDGGYLSGVRAAVEEFSGRHTIGPADDLCISVSGSGVFSRFIKLPPVPESVDEIIQYEARQQIPFDMDQVVWDYQPVKEEHEAWEEVKVGLFALKSGTVDQLMDIFQPWRRNLRLVQQAPLAVYNFLCLEGYNSEPVVAVDIGGKSTGVVVIDPPEFWLRTLRVGGSSLTERIESHFGVSTREAERIKERAGESGKAAQLIRVVGKPLGNILSEIQRSLGYYKSISPDVKFNKMVAVGHSFRLKGLERVLSQGMQTDFEVVDEVRNINLTGAAKKSIGGGVCGCAAVFGLLAQQAGRGPVKVNMVPEDVALENEMRSKKPLLAGAVAGLLAVIGLLILGEGLYGGSVEEHLEVGAGIAEELSALGSEYSRVQSDADALEEQLQLLTERYVRRDLFLHFLSELTRALPGERPGGSGDLLPGAVYIRGLDLRWVSRSDYERIEEEIETDEDREPDVRRRRPDRYEPDEPRRRERDEPDSVLRNLSAAGWDRVAGDEAVLMMEVQLESTVIRRAGEYIEGVVESLRDARYGGTGAKSFRRVKLVGTPTSVFRDSRTGEIVDDPDALEFIRFRIVAGVDDVEGEVFSSD